jgi:hypothetical protein
MHYRNEVWKHKKKLPRESNTINYHYVYHYHYEWIAGCLHVEMNTDTVPVCHREEESRRAVATAGWKCFHCNEPTKTHERLVREELALPFDMIDLNCRLHATVRRTTIP